MSHRRRCFFLNGILLYVFAAAFLVLTSWNVDAKTAKPAGNTSGQTTVIKMLTPQEALELIKKNSKNTDFVILDIRTPEEFESGHIEGAININYHSDTFVEDMDKLDKEKTYLVYCRTGRRSSDAVSIMTRQGFRELFRIKGDIVKWKSDGLPVVKKGK